MQEANKIMECKCSQISELEKIYNELNDVLKKSSEFNDKYSECKTNLSLLRTASWNATESMMLEQDIIGLPTMTDKLEDAYQKIVACIKEGLKKIADEKSQLQEIDRQYHYMESMKH